MIRNKRVFLDVDGVLADFAGHLIQYYDEVEDKDTSVTTWADERIVKHFHLTKNDVNFWLSIPPLIDPNDINFPIAGYCTARLGNVPEGITEIWLRENGFPSAPVWLTDTNESKVPMLLEMCVDIMLDDAPHNFRELNAAGIKTCLMDMPYNRDYKTNLRVDSIQEFGVFANPYFMNKLENKKWLER